MSLNPYSINVNARACNWSRIRELILSGMNQLFLMDPSEAQAREALALGVERLYIRIYSPFGEGLGHDSDFHTRHSPKKVVDYLNTHWAGFKNDKRVFFIPGYNEPTHHDFGPLLDEQIKWFVETGTLANQAGFGIVIGEFNTSKTFRVEGNGNCPDTARFGPIMKFLHKNRRAVLGLHDYSLVNVWAQLQDGFPGSMLDNPQWTVHGPQRPRPVWTNPKNVGRQFYFARWAALHSWAVQNGYDDYEAIFGECLWDHMTDDGIRPTYEAINKKYGTPKYPNMRGCVSLFEYYKDASPLPHAYTRAQFAADLFEQLKWARSNTPDQLTGMFLFAHNDLWPDYNTRELPELEMLMATNRAVEPNFTLFKGDLTNKTSFQRLIRDYPSRLHSRIVGNPIAPGETLVGIELSKAEHSDGTEFNWVRIKAPGRTGWVAVSTIDKSQIYLETRFPESAPEPEPEPEPIPEPTPEPAPDNSVITLDLHFMSVIRPKEQARSMMNTLLALSQAEYKDPAVSELLERIGTAIGVLLVTPDPEGPAEE